MPSPRRLKLLLSLFPMGAVLFFGFQNCGKGFKAASNADLNSLGFSRPGMILPLSLFASTGSSATAIETDVTPYLQQQTISNLRPGNHLSNGKIHVDLDDEYPNQIASPEQLIYSGRDPQFAQVNSYYHVDRLVSGLKALGIFPSSYPASHVNAHCRDGEAENNAYFDPSTNTLCLGFSQIGSFTAWAAHDADAVVHEFGHSINYAVVSGPDLLSSSPDLLATDEGVADVWAFMQNNNPYVARYFGYIITKDNDPTSPLLANFKGLRDLSSAPVYPTSLVGEAHYDSTSMSTVFFQLRQQGVPSDLLRRLAIRVLSDLQFGDTFAEITTYLVEEAAALNIDATTVRNVITARGLYRKDSVATLSLPAAKIFVIDNHATSIQVGGNCNNKLDAGETVVMFLDVTNGNSTLGSVLTRLTTNAPANEVQILPGAQYAWYVRFSPNSSYLQGLPAANRVVGSSLYQNKILYAAFVLKIGAGAAGKSYQFTLDAKGFNSVDSSPVLGSMAFTMPVTAVANIAGNCPGTGENNVWPR